jgi:hypothetical protein
MPIYETDIKILKSERMADTDDGGGRMTSNEVIDGQSNNMFPDISELDRTYGRVNLRKVFAAVLTDDVDTYYGANIIVSEPPADPNVHVSLFSTPPSAAWFDERLTAQDRIESYSIVGTLSPMRLIGDHYEGQRSVLAYQLITDPLPGVGEVYALVYDALIQYVRIMSVDHRTVTYYDEKGSFDREELTLGISDPLRYFFEGGSPSRLTSYQPPTKIHRTNIVEAVNYYGVAPLASPSDFGAMQVRVVDYKRPLLPSTQSESAMLDLQAGGMRPHTIDAGARDVSISQVSHTAMIWVRAANRQYNYVAQLIPKPAPMTLEISYRAQDKWYMVYDEAGTGELAGDGAGVINYTTGSVSLTLKEMPDVDTAIVFGWGSQVLYEVGSSATVEPVRYSYTVANPPIKPGSVTITWQVEGVIQTVTDDGAGTLTGAGTGWVDYGSGVVEMTPTQLPDPSTSPQITYYKLDKVLESFDATVVAGQAQVTLTQQPAPKTVKVRFTTVRTHKHEWPVERTTYITDDYWYIAGHDFYRNGSLGRVEETAWTGSAASVGVTMTDNGLGGMPFGSVDYTTRMMTVITSIHYLLGQVEYHEFTNFAGHDIVSWADYEQVESLDGEWLWTDIATTHIDVEYSVIGAAETQYIEQIPAQTLRIDLTPYTSATVVPSSVQFQIGSSVYIDIEGEIHKDPDPTTGVGTVAGTIDYSSGEVTLTLWGAGSSAFALQSLLYRIGPQMEAHVQFRTVAAPVRPASFTIAATAVDGELLTATADLNGVIAGNNIDGFIDTNTGIVEVGFGAWVLDSSLTPEQKLESWYDPARVDADGYIWRPRPIWPETCRYNVVVYVYLPLSADILGLDPVRLPQDGRVPIYRVGDVVVVHHTQQTTISTPTNGQVIDTGRVRLSYARLFDANDVPVPTERYSVDLDAGTVTLVDVSGLTAPLRLEDRIEDMALVSDLQINGTLTLTRGLSHAYPDGSYVSSAYVVGDMFARVASLFSQATWTSVWSDEPIGSDTTGKYNDVVYPVEVTNRGCIQERWAIIFTSSTAFKLIGEFSGQIALGDINSDFAPINPETSVPYFMLRAGGWGTGWATGNVLRFNTVAANHPIWIARTVLQSEAASGSDQFRLCVRGDVDTP